MLHGTWNIPGGSQIPTRGVLWTDTPRNYIPLFLRTPPCITYSNITTGIVSNAGLNTPTPTAFGLKPYNHKYRWIRACIANHGGSWRNIQDHGEAGGPWWMVTNLSRSWSMMTELTELKCGVPDEPHRRYRPHRSYQFFLYMSPFARKTARAS